MSKKKTNAKKADARPIIGSKILVNICLDRSGSMDGCRQATIDGYNRYLDELRQDKATEYSVTLTQFDSPGQQPELTLSYVDKLVGEVPPLSRDTYEPRGSTPLYDAIAETIRRVQDRTAGRPVLTVIITDGYENASQEFRGETGRLAIKSLIADKEAAGWTFVFLGADIDAKAAAAAIGVNVKNAATYGKAASATAFAAVGHSNVLYASNRMMTNSLHQTANEAFFTDGQRAAMSGGTGGTGTVTTDTSTTTPPVAGSSFRRNKRNWAVKLDHTE